MLCNVVFEFVQPTGAVKRLDDEEPALDNNSITEVREEKRA